MPNDNPVDILISQGYPREVAQQMVDSGTYDKMVNPLPTLPNLVGSPLGGGVNQTSDLTGTGAATGEVSPEIQQLLDQGYNLEEAEQLMASGNYAPNAVGEAEERILKTTDGPNVLSQDQGDPNALSNLLGSAGAGVSLEQAAYGLGSSLGAEKGTAKTLGIIGNAGKLALGTVRGIASGLGKMKKDQYVQDYYNKKSKEVTYTAAPQAENVNYLGGSSYGEEGGIQGKTLPIKAFLKNGGFKKTGYKKLM